MKTAQIKVNPENTLLLENYARLMGFENIEQAANSAIAFAVNTLIFQGKIPRETTANSVENEAKEAEKLLKKAQKEAEKGRESFDNFIFMLDSKQQYKLRLHEKKLRELANSVDAKTVNAMRDMELKRKAQDAKADLDIECLQGMEALNLLWLPLEKEVKQRLAAYLPEWKKDARRSDKRYIANGFRPKFRRLEEVEQRKKARIEMEANQ